MLGGANTPRKRGRRPRRSLRLLVAFPLLGLALLGSAFALWSEQLTINGNVETGNVDAGWTLAKCDDVDPNDAGVAMFAEADPVTGAVPQVDTINLFVEGAYPGYEAQCELEYTYFGSVPANVEEIRFIEKNLDGCTTTQSPSSGSFIAECDELTVIWADGLCTQFGGSGEFIGASLRVRVNNGAEVDAVHSFGLEVQLNQYNESACPS